MSEIITASILETPKPTHGMYEDGPEYSMEAIALLKDHVMDFMKANNIDPATVLFAGFNAELTKGSTDTQLALDDEHQTEDGTPIFYFGDARSLEPPFKLSDDPELQMEHWMVNPLKYAITHRSLGIYDKGILDTLSGEEPSGGDASDQANFGTYTYALDSQTLEQAKLAQLNI